MPLTRILIRTWFGPGSGVGTSLSTQALFAEGTIAAFIPRLLIFGNSRKNELSSVLIGAGFMTRPAPQASRHRAVALQTAKHRPFSQTCRDNGAKRASSVAFLRRP